MTARPANDSAATANDGAAAATANDATAATADGAAAATANNATAAIVNDAAAATADGAAAATADGAAAATANDATAAIVNDAAAATANNATAAIVNDAAAATADGAAAATADGAAAATADDGASAASHPPLQRQAANTARRTRLGYLGPIIVVVGAAVAVVALWFMRTQRPVAGEEIDRFTVASGSSQRTVEVSADEPVLVVRHEAASDRSFIELRDGDTLLWRALVPPYAGAKGRPAVAWSDKAVTVRVSRNRRAEVFLFARDTAHKLGTYRLAPEHEPIETHATGPITLTDHVRSYELVGGSGWNQLIALDLVRGGTAWKVDLGAEPITDAGVANGRVWLVQGSTRRVLDAATGTDLTDK